MDFDSVNKKIAANQSLDFGSIFSNSFELFKKVWVQGFIVLLLTTICILPFYLVAYIPLIANGVSDPEMLQYQELSPMAILGLCITFPIFMIALSAISLGLTAAFLRICKLKDLNMDGNDDYFFYFKEGRLRKVVILASIYLGLSIVGMLACGIGLFYLIVPFSLMPAFLAFNDELSAMEIVKSSFQLGNKNWLVIFGLTLLSSFLAQLGIIICFIGVFFTAMFAKVPTYFVYKDGVGFTDADDIVLEGA